MARNSEKNKMSDLEICKERIEALLREFNCIIEADDYNFPENTEDLSKVIDKINAEIHGLF